MHEEKEIGNAPYGKLLTIDFTYGRNSISGFLLLKMENWSLFQFVPVDFQLDGFVVVNNTHIKQWNRGEPELFKESVIISKNNEAKYSSEMNISDSKQLFEYLQEKALLQVELYRNDLCYVGKITRLRRSSFSFNLLTVRALWLEKENFTHKEIWMIYFDNDYLKSLNAYMGKNGFTP